MVIVCSRVSFVPLSFSGVRGPLSLIKCRPDSSSSPPCSNFNKTPEALLNVTQRKHEREPCGNESYPLPLLTPSPPSHVPVTTRKTSRGGYKTQDGFGATCLVRLHLFLYRYLLCDLHEWISFYMLLDMYTLINFVSDVSP